MDDQAHKIEHLKEEIAQTEEMNAELERLIQYTESEEYIEKVARERLGWVKKVKSFSSKRKIIRGRNPCFMPVKVGRILEGTVSGITNLVRLLISQVVRGAWCTYLKWPMPM